MIFNLSDTPIQGRKYVEPKLPWADITKAIRDFDLDAEMTMVCMVDDGPDYRSICITDGLIWLTEDRAATDKELKARKRAIEAGRTVSNGRVK